MYRTFLVALFSLAVVVLAAADETSTGWHDDDTPAPTTPRHRISEQRVANRTAVADDGTETSPVDRESRQTMPAPWAAHLFYQVLADFTVQQDVGTAACQKQTLMYTKHLKNNTFWAVKMYDSWSKFPNGLLVGTTHQMGIYEECISVHQPVQGKYCMAEVRLSSSNLKNTQHDETETFDHAWSEILDFIDYGDRFPRNKMSIGICIPESCSAENLETSLQNKFNAVFSPHQVQIQIKVKPAMCSTDKSMRPYDTGYYVISSLMYLTVLLCCLSTLIHFYKVVQTTEMNKKSDIPELVLWFSFIHNCRNLIKYNKDNELNIFNGVKTLIMLLVLFGHQYSNFVKIPLSYPKDSEMVYKIGPGVFLTGMNLVDSFFFIAGLLLYIMVKPQIIKGGCRFIQIPMIIIYKYIRFIPAYGATMLVTAFIIPYSHNGPLWNSNMWDDADRCRNYWWANLLVISNFIDVDKQCLIVSWYISCLFQFVIFGVINVYICVKKPKLGASLIVLLLIVFLALQFVLTYATRSYGLLRVFIPFLQDLSTSYEFTHLYRPFYVRGIPFYAGLLAGIVIEELKRREFKPSLLTVYVWSIIIFIVCYVVQSYGMVFYKRHRPYDIIEQSIYAVLSHCVWSFGLFGASIYHFTSGFGPLKKLLDNRYILSFGRLTYTVYLVNMPIILIMINRQTVAISSNKKIWYDYWINSLVRSYVAGLILHLCIEAPFNSIIKFIFFRGKGSSDREENVERRNSKIETPSSRL